MAANHSFIHLQEMKNLMWAPVSVDVWSWFPSFGSKNISPKELMNTYAGQRVRESNIRLFLLIIPTLLFHSCTTRQTSPQLSSVDAVYLYSREESSLAPLQSKSPGVSFYQTTLSHTIHSSCPMFPSCSRYSQLSHQKSGKMAGTIQSMSRLLTEVDASNLGLPVIKINNHLRYLDFP